MARLKLQNQQAPDFTNGARSANGELGSPVDEDSSLLLPKSRHGAPAAGECQDIGYDGLEIVAMEQSPDSALTSATTAFRHEGDGDDSGTFPLQHLSGASKLPVGGGA